MTPTLRSVPAVPSATSPAALTSCAAVATVHAVDHISSIADGALAIIVDVETVSGQRFRGHLEQQGHGSEGAPVSVWPGMVLAVRFDPARPEEVVLTDDMTAARAAFDAVLIRKGLTTADKLDLIRRGVKSHSVVTAMKTTGRVCEGYRQVELDVIVSRPDGGQFPAHETTFIPDTSVATVVPGSVIDTYYRAADHSRVAVCVPRR